MILMLGIGLGGVGVGLLGFCWAVLRASAAMQSAERLVHPPELVRVASHQVPG